MNRLVATKVLHRIVHQCGGQLTTTTTTTTTGSRALSSAAAPPPPPPPAPKMVEVFVNDRPVMVEPGTTVLEACARVGVDIPRFCYHERLSVAGNCRMCLVEIEKAAKPVASCAMPVMPGWRIKTDSDMTRKAREGVMEFLLLNHPLDCPICDQGGECDLQDQSMAFGSDRSRLQIQWDDKRAVEDKNIGPLVKTIMTRCIHCTRCVRFMNEIAGCADLGTSGRGADMQIGTYLQNTALVSELSGNIVDICPVGALTSKPYTFTGRPWELRRFDSIDIMDAVGSNISVCQRSGDFLRIIPRLNEDVNEEWLADKSRHAPVDGLKAQRLTVPMVRPSSDSTLQECDWEDALISVGQAINHVDPSRIVAIVGPHTDAETMVAIKDLVNSLGSENVFVHTDTQLDPSALPGSQDLDFRYNYLFNTGIADIEKSDFILLVGSNPRLEAPMVNARIRKSWRNSWINDIALIGPKGLDLLYDYDWLGDDIKTLKSVANGTHPISKKLASAKKPIIILGQQILRSNNDNSNAYDLVKQIADKHPNIEFNILHSNASQVAAYDLGLRNGSELNLEDNGEPALVWLFGVDDSQLKIPQNNTFLIYQGHTGEIGANRADVVLPGAAFTEKQSIYVNLEGRSQQTLAAITPPSMARIDWKIVRAVSEICNHTLGYDSLLGLRQRMKQLSPNLVYCNENLKIDAIRPPSGGPVSPKAANDSIRLRTKLADLLDYYQTDVISRASPTMAKCVVALRKEIDKRGGAADERQQTQSSI
ncbi:NADH-ubiquinone oxidoreductase 75 kDa subunit, mitochondrial-like [Oppia nitens]|uniref:NADH-ubiquinone oxidoreductase 75 kDa subunit, mitochondrial-like n=1 Tax=Oppia nitens TaxID=1686743 RepID=UPI0023DC6A14|nr:NADH-ubiquinone oxidoreductase 75 kDa subunit, mitochondrial-like [Oppia nitens]